MTVKLKVVKGKATIEEGADTAIGRMLARHKGKITVNTPLAKGEFTIAKAKKDK